jgi:hypothetical protein
MFPDVQIVGIVRHPGAVVSSVRRRFRRPLGPAMRNWRRYTKVLLQEAAAFGDRFAVLRYEDLVTAPEPTMGALLHWLGEPWSPAVLAHHEVERPVAEAEGFTRTDAPIDTSRIDEWTHYLRGAQRRLLAKRTGELAAFMGYDPLRPDPVEQWGTAERPLLTGSEIRRQLERGGAIDWTTRPRPPVADRPLLPPAPPRRRRRRSELVHLDDVKLGTVLRHRALLLVQRTLPEETRRRADELRRKNRRIDRIIGPR